MKRVALRKMAAGGLPEHAGPGWRDDIQDSSFDIFVSTPMSAYAADESAYKSNRDTLMELFDSLKKRSRFSRFFCPALLFDDLTSFDGEQDALTQDFLALEASEAFILYYMPPLPSKPSSVFVEAGMALAARIPSVYIVRSRLDLPYMLRSADQYITNRLASGWRSSFASPGQPLVKIIEIGTGEAPDADEIAAWFETKIKRPARIGFC